MKTNSLTKIIPLLCFVLLSSFAYGSNLSGTITDANKKPLGFASVALYNVKDSSLIKGAVCDVDGKFIIKNISQPNVYIVCTRIGYEKKYSSAIALKEGKVTYNMVLGKRKKALKRVTITNKRPVIEVRADKTIFNVSQSVNAAGTNVLDLLRKAPGVQVNKDENVEMRGKANVLIYIDGRPTYLDQKDLTAMLKNMQSNDVASIELITNPSAKYDASGNAGIINIKLKKNKKFGTNGNVTIGLAQGIFFKQNASINLNNRNKKTNIFGSYSVNNGKNTNFQNFDRIQNARFYDFESENIYDGTTHSARAGVDYFINDQNVIGLMANGSYSGVDFTSESTTNIGSVGSDYDQVLVATNQIPSSRKNISLNTNYKYEDTLGRMLNIDADGSIFKSTGQSYQPNTYWDKEQKKIINEAIYRNNTPTTINILAGKADYEQNALKGKIGFGIKSALVKTDNDFQFYDVVNNVDTLNLNRSNHFVYSENVNAGYINYNRTIKKLSLQLGLRAEQTNSKGQLNSAVPQNDDTVSRHYLDFFPSMGLSYSMGQNHQFGLSYSRRIDRPSYQDLNPFEMKLDELTYEKGNAFLRPQYTNSYQLTHTFKRFLTTSLSYSRVNDLFMQTTDTTEFSRTYVTQKNFATMDIAGINISAAVPIKKWWMAIFNINANMNDVKADFEGRALRNRYNTYTFYSDHTFTLPKQFKFNVSGWYTGPNYWGGTFKLRPMGSLDIGLSKSLLNKKMNVKLSVSDVFLTQPWYAKSNFAGLIVDANGRGESRQLRLNVSYRFGRSEIAKQRKRKSGADSESKRIKNK